MDSHESFKVMESFVYDITDKNMRQRFIDAISFQKPFQNFNQLIHNIPKLKEEWFAYKNEQYIELVKEQLESFNSLENDVDVEEPDI